MSYANSNSQPPTFCVTLMMWSPFQYLISPMLSSVFTTSSVRMAVSSLMSLMLICAWGGGRGGGGGRA